MKYAEAREWQTHGNDIGRDVANHHRRRRVGGKELRHVEDLARRSYGLCELLVLECLSYWQLNGVQNNLQVGK